MQLAIVSSSPSCTVGYYIHHHPNIIKKLFKLQLAAPPPFSAPHQVAGYLAYNEGRLLTRSRQKSVLLCLAESALTKLYSYLSHACM